jgi:hypothetical protein
MIIFLNCLKSSSVTMMTPRSILEITDAGMPSRFAACR